MSATLRWRRSFVWIDTRRAHQDGTVDQIVERRWRSRSANRWRGSTGSWTRGWPTLTRPAPRDPHPHSGGGRPLGHHHPGISGEVRRRSDPGRRVRHAARRGSSAFPRSVSSTSTTLSITLAAAGLRRRSRIETREARVLPAASPAPESLPAHRLREPPKPSPPCQQRAPIHRKTAPNSGSGRHRSAIGHRESAEVENIRSPRYSFRGIGASSARAVSEDGRHSVGVTVTSANLHALRRRRPVGAASRDFFQRQRIVWLRKGPRRSQRGG